MLNPNKVVPSFGYIKIMYEKSRKKQSERIRTVLPRYD